MSMMEQAKERARRNRKRIALPEGEESRTVQAAARIRDEGLAEPILIGDPDRIRETGKKTGTDLCGLETVNPETSPKLQAYADMLYALRKAKGLTREEAEKLTRDPMYYGMLMVKTGDADGLVSGAEHTTGDMLRPALQIIRTKPGIQTVSSCFVMDCPNKALGENGLLIYADCVVVPNPTAGELAQIAVSAAETARVLFDFKEPRVAMLSFSTKGSAKHELVDKVRQAVEIAHQMAPDLTLDGEMQFDAALIPEVGRSKAPGSPVAGRANVLIFPDLQSGNIGYKITQRIGGAECFAVLQGLAAPCNDLSRGCSVEDIVNTVVLTALQAG